MPKSSINLARPEYWINRYIFNELKDYDPSEVGVSLDQNIVPIYPAGSNINEQDFYQQLIADSSLSNPLMIRYDKLMRFRTSPFYRIKKEQVILEILHTDFDVVDNVTKIIEQALDREDVAGQAVNSYNAANVPQNISYNVFFHKFRVFKVDESRDLVELNSVNLQFARTRIIVEFDYHEHDSSKNYD